MTTEAGQEMSNTTMKLQEVPKEAKEIVAILGRDGTFDILRAVLHEGDKAYLSRLENVLRHSPSRVTVFSRLKELERVGIITGMPQLDPTEKRLVLRYKVSRKGLDILSTIARLNESPLAIGQTPVTEEVVSAGSAAR